MIDIRYNNDNYIVIRTENKVVNTDITYVIINTYNLKYSKYYCVCAFIDNDFNIYFQDILDKINIKSVIMPYDSDKRFNGLYIERSELDKLEFLLKLNNGSMYYDYK